MPETNPPSIDWLYDFLSVAKTQSFTKAAHLRNSSQPSLSRRIKLLEHWAGRALIDRTQNPVVLTDAGLLARDKFERIVGLAEEARSAIRTSSDVAPEGVVVGFAPELEWVVNDVLRLFQARSSNLSYRARTLEADAAREAFRTQDLHFFVQPVTQLGANSDGGAVRVKSDRLMPVTVPTRQGRPVHELAQHRGRQKPYSGFALATFFGQQVAALIRERELSDLQKLLCTHLPGAIADNIVKERGIGWLPQSFAGRYLQDGTLVRAGSADFDIPVEYALMRAPSPMPPSIERSWDTVMARTRAAR